MINMMFGREPCSSLSDPAREWVVKAGKTKIPRIKMTRVRFGWRHRCVDGEFIGMDKRITISL
jgi:hypothetical protein